MSHRTRCCVSVSFFLFLLFLWNEVHFFTTTQGIYMFDILQKVHRFFIFRIKPSLSTTLTLPSSSFACLLVFLCVADFQWLAKKFSLMALCTSFVTYTMTSPCVLIYKKVVLCVLPNTGKLLATCVCLKEKNVSLAQRKG